MMININDWTIDIELCPIYGLAIGVNYYNPELEPNVDEVDDWEFYNDITFLFVLVGLKIRWWRN